MKGFVKGFLVAIPTTVVAEIASMIAMGAVIEARDNKRHEDQRAGRWVDVDCQLEHSPGDRWRLDEIEFGGEFVPPALETRWLATPRSVSIRGTRYPGEAAHSWMSFHQHWVPA